MGVSCLETAGLKTLWSGHQAQVSVMATSGHSSPGQSGSTIASIRSEC